MTPRLRAWTLLWLAVSAPLAAAGLTVTRGVAVVADGVNLANPRMLPGATLDETLLVVSPAANGLAAIGAVTVTDTIPATLKLRVADLGATGGGPVEFADGGVAGLGLLGSGLQFRFTSLASAGDGVDFSTDGVTWSYAPVADAAGYDANVRAIRVRLSGSHATGGAFRLRYRVMIR